MSELIEFTGYDVYVKPDESGRITAINSSAFLADTDGWVKIDHGEGDAFHHAQGNYFPQPIIDERGVYRYKLVDGVPVERTPEEMDADYTVHTPTPSIESRVETVESKQAELEESLDILLSGVTSDE